MIIASYVCVLKLILQGAICVKIKVCHGLLDNA